MKTLVTLLICAILPLVICASGTNKTSELGNPNGTNEIHAVKEIWGKLQGKSYRDIIPVIDEEIEVRKIEIAQLNVLKGETFFSLKEYEKAELALREALPFPRRGAAAHVLGRTLYEQQRYDEALTMYESALGHIDDTMPRDVVFQYKYHHAICSFAISQDRERAIKDYEMFDKDFPEYKLTVLSNLVFTCEGSKEDS